MSEVPSAPGAPDVPDADATGASNHRASLFPPARKNSTLAASLSVLPGLGQLYNGNIGKAVFFPLATGLSIGGAIGLVVVGDTLGRRLITVSFAAFTILSLLSVMVFLGLFVLGLGFWGSAIVDARLSAEESTLGLAEPRRWWFLRL